MNIHTGSIIQHDQWQSENLAAIRGRLSHLVEDRELAKIIASEFQGVFLRRLGDSLELYCYDPQTQTLSEIMSRIDIMNPLEPLAEYSKAVLLTVGMLSRAPERIYIAGMGGGRLSMIFHHLFPEVNIDGSDIDPTMIRVCEDYFGLCLDERHDVRILDSREDLDQRDHHYDIVIIDVFFGKGEHPDHLATVEFFEACREKMTEDGILAVNLVNMDAGCMAKIAAIAHAFPHCLDWDHSEAHVIFAANNPFDLNQISRRTDLLMPLVSRSYSANEQIRHISPVTADEIDIAPLRDLVESE